MGLDQYAYRTKNVKKLTDVGYPESDGLDEFDYWRKFYGLQDWMENLYHEKGGKGDFNCVPMRLTLQDLDRLERDMQEDEFYEDRFYEKLEDEKKREVEHLKDFIQTARASIAEGYEVYYDSWW